MSKTRERIADVRTLLQYTTRERVALISTLETLTATRERVVGGDILRELGGGSALFRGEASRPRIATVETQVARERFQIIGEQMRSLASNLTATLDNSVYDGFSRGAKRGFEVLSLGLLRIVEDSFLKRLETGLGDLLTSVGTGPGFWGGLLRAFFGGAIGGAAGGIGGGGSAAPLTHAGSAAGHFASGGFVPPGKWGWTGEEGPERVYGGNTGVSVIPHAGQTVIHHHTNIFNIKPDTKGSYSSPKSQRQIAEQVASMLQSRLT